MPQVQKTEQINFLVDLETKRKLVNIANSEDMSIAQIVRKAVRKVLEDGNQKTKSK